MKEFFNLLSESIITIHADITLNKNYDKQNQKANINCIFRFQEYKSLCRSL